MAVKRFYFFGSYSSVRPFIMEVESDGNGEFTIPTTGGGYNYVVKTSDGQTFNGVTGNLTITFPSPNTRYDVEITGDFPRIYFAHGSERLKIKDIKQWGDVVWGASQNQAFYGCEDMTCSALDLPDMEHITSGYYMLMYCSMFALINFDLKFANLTNGEGMFRDMMSFNPPNFAPTLENLTNGAGMFYNATSFAQDIYAPNSIHLLDDRSMFTNTKIAKITMNNTALTTTNSFAFQCSQLTDLILIDRKVDLRISYSPLLLGAKIDDLFTSLGIANTGATITISAAQNTSGIDTTIATNKGWTIVIL